MKRGIFTLTAVFLILGGSIPLAAQEQTSSIQGTVTDQRGGPNFSLQPFVVNGGTYHDL